MLRKLVEQFRFVIVLGVATLAATATATLGWSAALAFQWIGDLIGGEWRDTNEVIGLLQIIDVLLIATVQVIVCIGLYELFVGALTVPDWLRVSSLGELKVAIAELVVLVVAVKFVELLIGGSKPLDVLYYGVAVAVVAAAMIGLVATAKSSAGRRSGES